MSIQKDHPQRIDASIARFLHGEQTILPKILQ